MDKVKLQPNALSNVGELFHFFHEYGHRVGMVPRSSLKKGKYSQMVEKRTKTTQQQQNKINYSPQAKTPPSSRVSSALG